ncbi:MAG: RNA polymerase sigma factor FliA [Cellvibrionales bacterium]|nr:MAG: RNA polymerase sigma factor FliA [Cellvibrionales bacterium]
MTKAVFYADEEFGNSEKLVNEYLHLVKKIAFHIAARLPAGIDIDDLTQVGLIGLLEAAKSYRTGRGASFETFAGIRIRGAILDEVRRFDWSPRSIQQKARWLAQATRSAEIELQRCPRDSEIAAQLGIEMGEYYQLLRDTAVCKATFVDATEVDLPDTKTPQGNVQDAAFQTALADHIEQLPEREKTLMSLYYDEELNLKEIGAVLDISESRVSQIHSQILNKLRSSLLSWTSDTDDDSR